MKPRTATRSALRGVFGAVSVALFAIGVGAAAANGLGPGGTFTDDNGNVHQGMIEAIADQGVTKGCNPPVNDRYCPGSTVTRGQMAAFLVRARGLVDDGGKDWFGDDDGSIFENDINKLAASGITKGCNPPANDKYCPDSKVTREQMAAFLVRAFGYDDPGTANFFTDTSTSIFKSDIDKLRVADVTKGCNPPVNDRYCPTSPVLRDQMGSFLARALELAPLTPPAVATFGDGVWIVGVDIQPGTYRTAASPGLCYGARLSGFGGTLGEIIANELSFDPITVTIEPTDAGFESIDCDLWTNQLTPRTGSPTAGFGDGYWSVGDEVAAGLWRNDDSSQFCYWERLSGYSWELGDIIANEFSSSIQTVQVGAGDVAFHTDLCGNWTYLGP